MTDRQTISWIFLATALASQKQPADFRSISGIADGINHAVPTHEELQTSTCWLIKQGLIKADGYLYSLTEKGKSDYAEASRNDLMAFAIWDNVDSILKKYGE